MTFEEALPRLLTAYSKEELVPFTGAGMSAKSCTLWFDFVLQLCRYADLPRVPEADSTAGDLIRLADRAVQVLLNRSDEALQKGVREALKGVDYRNVPLQTQLLTQVYWPLILTTNYDDWLIGCAAAQRWSQAEENRMRVLGRSPADCYEVLTSLYVRSPPLLWALQGFLGGQYREYDATFAARHVTDDLASQVVVGHQQYQLVMHREPHFRRAFSEVLRRRSLLFIGSGLQEDYLLNLFGEVQIMHGPGSLPHYALMRENGDLDLSSTLLARYNIVPITYRNFSDLPRLLDQFAKSVAELNASSFNEGRRYALDLSRPDYGGYLALRRGSLPFPEEDACAVLSVGLNEDGTPKLGTSARSFFGKVRERFPDFEESYEPLADAGFFKVRGLPRVYALAARTPGSQEADRRDLRLLAPTVKRFLELCASEGYGTIHLPLLAAGKGRNWHRSLCLIEMVRGIRKFVARRSDDRPLPAIHIHIVDPGVLYPLRAGKLFIEENLCCDDLRFWVILERARGASERLLLLRDPTDKLGDVAAFLGLSDKSGWGVSVSPPPTVESRVTILAEAWSTTLTSLGLTNYSTLILTRSA